tara:strand:+ start:2693 stop:3580 length:888 start_codon:yes stop_codon:yes gene_type:complete
MLKKICPICDTDVHSKKVYDENLPSKIEKINYSGRKKPDGYHYEMVRCKNCSLLYASSIYEENMTDKLYEESDFPYSEELNGLKKTYGSCLKYSENLISKKDNFLEIGCGNGFLLEEAINQGWKNVEGVEPSIKAIEQAHTNIKKKIVNTTFKPNMFKKNNYDLVFFAMILEHVPNVNDFLSEIFNILNPGGVVIGICHDERHFLSKIFKNKHPIINDEHNYVFGKKTLKEIFLKNKFKNLKINDLKNYYSLDYWFNMAPVPQIIKKPLKLISKSFVKDQNIGIKAGNIFLVGNK